MGVATPLESDVASMSAASARPDEDALSALVALVGPDLEACNRAIVARMESPVALIPQLAAHIVAAGGKRLRPLLTLAAARLCGYAGRPARQSGRLRRVHPHRDAAARRRGGRKPVAPRPGLGQRGVRQQGVGAGGRLPVRPRLPADGGGRLAEGAGHPVAGGGHHRRRRGAAAGHAERPVHARGALPGGGQGQDRGAVRGGLPGRRGGGGSAGGRGDRRWPSTA